MPGGAGPPAVGGGLLRLFSDFFRISSFASANTSPNRHPRRARLPTAIDDSLGRFETVYAAAGHPFWVFPTTMLELSLLTGGAVTKRIAIAEPSWGRTPDS